MRCICVCVHVIKVLNQRFCIIRNVMGAPICNQFSVGPPGSRVREVDLFGTDH